MKKLALSLIDWFIPESFKSKDETGEWSEALRRSRLVIGFGLITIPLVVLMFVVRVIMEGLAVNSNIFLLPFAAGMLAAMMYLVKRGAYDVSAIIISFLPLIVIPLRVVNTGGIGSAVVLWYILVPMLSAMLVSPRHSVVTSFIASVQLYVIAYHKEFGIDVVSRDVSPGVQFAVMAIIIFLTAGLVSVYEIQRRKHTNEIVQKTIDLKKQKIITEHFNRTQSAILNSVNQGFLIFGPTGKCLEAYSRICEKLLESIPSGKQVWDVLQLKGEDKNTFIKWMEALFSESLPFDTLESLAPQTYAHSKGLKIALHYFPVYREGRTSAVVLVATDMTAELRAKEEAEREKAYAKMVTNLVKNNTHFQHYFSEMANLFSTFEGELNKSHLDLNKLYRILHTVKACASSIFLQAVVTKVHEIENQISAARKEKIPLNVERVKYDFDEVKEQIAEVRREFGSLIDSGRSEERYLKISGQQLLGFLKNYRLPDQIRLANDLVEQYLRRPIGDLFEPFELLLANMAIESGKELQPLRLFNGEIKVFPDQLQPLLTSLTHVFRNVVDHGIEDPSLRLECGKDVRGRIEVSFERLIKGEKSLLRIAISDDGKGIDPNVVRTKLVEAGRASEVQGESDARIIQHIFDDSFSTRDTVDLASGRGVGMNAVLAEAKALGGRAYVESKLGTGTRTVIEVPEPGPDVTLMAVA